MARDGYHGANLDLIAREAGFSKGAVYSNFDSKAALFLGVLDLNMAAMTAGGGWDPFESAPPDGGPDIPEEAREAIKGFALATLEFIATAAREEELVRGLAQRMGAVTRLYTDVAMKSRPEAESIPPDEMGGLLAALNQGAALLTLSGITTVDQRVLRTGMRRLLDPAPAAGSPQDAGDSGPALQDRVLDERIVASIHEGPA